MKFKEESLLAPTLLAKGHKIVAIEKFQKSEKKDDDEKQARDASRVLTRGTYPENEEIGYSSQFCLSIIEENLKFGLVYFEATTHEFYARGFRDDIYRANLRPVVVTW